MVDPKEIMIHRFKPQTIFISSGEIIALNGAGHTIAKIPFLNSQPPKGCFHVTNLYVDPATGKLVVEYDNTPV